MENQHVTQKLFTEIFRPQSLDQAIIVPRIREDLSKGLTGAYIGCEGATGAAC